MQPCVFGADSTLFIVLNAGSVHEHESPVRATIERVCDEAGRHHRIFLVDEPGRLQPFWTARIACQPGRPRRWWCGSVIGPIRQVALVNDAVDA